MTRSRPYKKPPLALALLEVQHPDADALSRGELAGIKAALVKSLPLQSAEEQVELQFAVGSGVPATAAGPQKLRTLHRFHSRSKTTSATFTTNSFSIETTSYEGWAGFRALLELVSSALMDVAPVDGIQRIGLRYIDEIRVPATVEAIPDWRLWIDSSLVAPNQSEIGLRPVQQQSVVQYATQNPGELVTLRYGAVVGPPAVGQGSLVRPTTPAPGPFFLLDTDAAWEVVPGEPVPELDVAVLLETADRLHAPVKALFEASLTERLRTEVLDVE